MAEVIVADLGTIVPLPQVDPEALRKLGEQLLPLGEPAAFIGKETSTLAKKRALHVLDGFPFMDGIRRASETTTTSSEDLYLLGVDVLRGQPWGGTEYKRPRGDGWKGKEADALFKRVVHAHVALEDEVDVNGVGLVQERHVIEPGQLFLARPETPYNVKLPDGAVNLEFVLCRDDTDIAVTWDKYCAAQPNPVLR